MPFSDTRFDDIACAVLRARYRSRRPITLDIGAGAGKGSKIFGPIVEVMDAVEVFRKYLDEYDLRAKYRTVFCQNIMDWSPGNFSAYDLLIAGDVLEHLTIPNAKKLLANARLAGCDMLVQVPFLCSEGPAFGNDFEIHIQDDLTREIMASRYPGLFEVHADDRLGLYML